MLYEVITGEFQVFKDVLASGGAVKALVAENCGHYSRKMITDLEDTAKIYGAKGLAWMKVTPEGLDGGIAKFFAASAKEVTAALGAGPGRNNFV